MMDSNSSENADVLWIEVWVYAWCSVWRQML